MKTYTQIWQYHAELEMFRTSRRENQNIYFVFSNFFPPKMVPLMR